MPILAGAVKCPTCGTAQDWRRFLTLGNTSISLIVALLSVITVAGPAILDLISPSSDVNLLRLSHDEDGISVVLINHGRADAFLDQWHVHGGDNVLFSGSADMAAIERGSHLSFILAVSPNQIRSEMSVYEECNLGLTIVNLAGETEVLKNSLPCRN